MRSPSLSPAVAAFPRSCPAWAVGTECPPGAADDPGPVVHVLRCWPEPFQAILDGVKRYEVRHDDRAPRYAVGHYLELQEYAPDQWPSVPESGGPLTYGAYTGRSLTLRVTYKTRGGTWGLSDSLCVLGVEVVPSDGPLPDAPGPVTHFQDGPADARGDVFLAPVPDLDAIQARAEAATGGRWGVTLGSGGHHCTAVVADMPDGLCVFVADCLPDWVLRTPYAPADHGPTMEFLAHSREDVLALVAYARHLLRRLQAAEAARAVEAERAVKVAAGLQVPAPTLTPDRLDLALAFLRGERDLARRQADVERGYDDASADRFTRRADALTALASGVPRLLEAVQAAWGVIANAGSGRGDWTRESPEWRQAAERWRDTYWLDSPIVRTNPGPLPPVYPADLSQNADPDRGPGATGGTPHDAGGSGQGPVRDPGERLGGQQWYGLGRDVEAGADCLRLGGLPEYKVGRMVRLGRSLSVLHAVLHRLAAGGPADDSLRGHARQVLRLVDQGPVPEVL